MNAEALRSLLTERRASVAPETHGLSRPSGKGRRAAGLAQHQMDLLLNRGLGTYQRLESGKYRHPPVDLLLDIARLLRLSELEWIALCRYAGIGDPPCPLSPRSGEKVPHLWKDAVKGISHAACVMSASWHVLAHNQSFEDIFAPGTCPDNTLEWLLFDGRHLLPNWADSWARHLLPMLRADLAGRPEDAELRRIESAVLADPVAGPLYASASAVAHPYEAERPLMHARLGPGWINMCLAQPLSSPGARLCILVFRPMKASPATILPPRNQGCSVPAMERVQLLRS
ncbi:XRE family transcriptional regulator [Streptomyces sp. NPDC017056]|uniref:MmyB family transcriptional regulator n=1 Tax=Streptomyces sp. NPDC017056 TaxID=3364973 RepID=UPI0037A65E56